MLMDCCRQARLKILLGVFSRVSLSTVIDLQRLGKPEFFIWHNKYTQVPQRYCVMFPVLMRCLDGHRAGLCLLDFCGWFGWHDGLPRNRPGRKTKRQVPV